MASQSDLSVRAMCCVLGVSVSGSYAWRDRTPSQRNIANAVMTERIRQIHLDSYESYGAPHARSRYPQHQQAQRLLGYHPPRRRPRLNITSER